MSTTFERPGVAELRQEIAVFRRNWPWLVLLGVALVGAGVLALASLAVASLATAVSCPQLGSCEMAIPFRGPLGSATTTGCGWRAAEHNLLCCA